MEADIRRDQVCHNSKGNRRKRKDVGNNETAIIDDGDRNRGNGTAGKTGIGGELTVSQRL